MKRLVFIAVICCCLVIWLSGGCGKPAENKNALQQVNEPTKGLTAYVAGTWQMRDGVFRFVIEPNGIVSSAVIPLMDCTIRPHQTTYVPMRDGNVSDFTGGDLTAEYDPITRNLFVYIELENFLIRFYDIRTGGNQVDRFEGPVSEDGKVWICDWFSMFDYGPDFPVDYNEIGTSPCIFDKVEEYKPPQEPGKKSSG